MPPKKGYPMKGGAYMKRGKRMHQMAMKGGYGGIMKAGRKGKRGGGSGVIKKALKVAGLGLGAYKLGKAGVKKIGKVAKLTKLASGKG